MLQYKTDFQLEDFLKSGSVFAFENQVWLMWGQPQSLNYRPAYPSVCTCEFFLKEPLSWNHYPNVFKCNIDQALELLGSDESHSIKTKWSKPEKDKFSQQYHWIQNCFAQNEIEKAVPYIFEDGSSEVDESVLLANILVHSLNQLSGYLYGQWAEGGGRLGMTPEVLVEQISKNNFSTMAVAGTTTLKDYEVDPDQFLNNSKENKEHQWVVDDILKVLSKFGDVEIDQLGILKTLSLVHLHTQIRLKAPLKVNIEDIVLKLHPTAALGTYPRGKNFKVMSYLNKLSERKRFGAPFGFSISEDEALFVVAIRNLEWIGKQLRIGAGCGVVPESHLDNEWQELENKRDSVKKIFGLL